MTGYLTTIGSSLDSLDVTTESPTTGSWCCGKGQDQGRPANKTEPADALEQFPNLFVPQFLLYENGGVAYPIMMMK